MKPKQQTKQQLMEIKIAALEHLIANKDVIIQEQGRMIKFSDSSFNKLAIAAIIIGISALGFGLYTGHKITQRAKPEKIYVGSDYRTGYEIGFKSALKENTINTYANGYTDGFRDGNLGNKSKALNWQPKTVKVIYRQIHHTKGAERLRL